MKKFLLAATAAAVVAVSPLALAGTAHANAGSPNCMTKAEWFKIKDGVTRDRVKQITGFYGKKTNDSYYSDGEHDIDVDYQQCNRYGTPIKGSWNTVWISYANGHYNHNYDWVRGPMEVDYKGSWSTPWTF